MKFTEPEYLKQGFGQPYAWLDLVNSQEWDGFGRFTDHLANPSWRQIFLHYWSFSNGSAARVTRAEWISLRTLFRRFAERISRGRPLSSRDIARLNGMLGVPSCQKIVRGKNGYRIELLPARASGGWILSRIAASFAEMLTQHEPKRLKICPNGGCQWVFYDRTKGKTRIWCNDRTCGNRARVRRARGTHE